VLCEYQQSGVSFTFRYGRHVPHPPGVAIAEEPADSEPMKDSQLESYMWVGHGRAIVRDFRTFADAFGDRMAEAMLVELGKRWPLTVRNYAGNEILAVEEKGRKVHNHSEKLGDEKLSDVINKAMEILEERRGQDSTAVERLEQKRKNTKDKGFKKP
jgi:hypothetical protein